MSTKSVTLNRAAAAQLEYRSTRSSTSTRTRNLTPERKIRKPMTPMSGCSAPNVNFPAKQKLEL